MRYVLLLLLSLAIPAAAHAESWWYHYCSSSCAKYGPSKPTYQCKASYDYYSDDYHAWRDNYRQPSEAFHKCCAKAGKQSCSRPSKRKGQSEAQWIWKKTYEMAGQAAMEAVASRGAGGGAAAP
jgi:hypothetical protein